MAAYYRFLYRMVISPALSIRNLLANRFLLFVPSIFLVAIIVSLSLSRRERNALAKAWHGTIFSPCDVRSNFFAAFDADDKPGCQRLGPGATAHGRHDAWTTVFGRHKHHDEDVLPVLRPSTCAVPLSPYRTRRFSGCLQLVQCVNTVQMLFTHDHIRVAGKSTLFFSRKKKNVYAPCVPCTYNVDMLTTIAASPAHSRRGSVPRLSGTQTSSAVALEGGDLLLQFSLPVA
jgi:hypothetical protein